MVPIETVNLLVKRYESILNDKELRSLELGKSLCTQALENLKLKEQIKQLKKRSRK